MGFRFNLRCDLERPQVHDNTTSFELMVLPAGEKATSIAVGQNHTAILTSSGKILMCGSDAAMQLGALLQARVSPCALL
jgi:hypothetical protein